MKTAKEFYRTYQADYKIAQLNIQLAKLIAEETPQHVLEFGCGSGKNLQLISQILLYAGDVPFLAETCGIDISLVNIIKGFAHNLPFLIYGDETNLRHLCNFDVTFTCSVLDHIPDIDGIIAEFKRIANKSIFLAETNDVPAEYYYPHDYESYGFTKLNYTWKSDSDNATYYIWKWTK